MPSSNPYAAPANVNVASKARPNHLQAVKRIYWWVGLVGTAGCGLYVVAEILVALANVGIRRDEIADRFPTVLVVFFQALFFNYCRLIANRLSVDPARIRWRSRFVGFAMAVLYFPILIVPGLYCVWKIDKHFQELDAPDRD